MTTKSQEFLQIPAALTKRIDEFSHFTNTDVALISYVVFHRYDRGFNSVCNIKMLLKWFGLKDHTGNIKKVKGILANAQNRYLNIRPELKAERSLPISNFNVNTLLRISFKPEFISFMSSHHFQRVPRSCIEAIVNHNNYDVADLSCYYLLLSAGMKDEFDEDFKDEIEAMKSKYYSIIRIAATLDISPTTAKRALTRLEELGVIRCDEKRKIGMTSNGFYSDPITYRFAIV